MLKKLKPDKYIDKEKLYQDVSHLIENTNSDVIKLDFTIQNRYIFEYLGSDTLITKKSFEQNIVDDIKNFLFALTKISKYEILNENDYHSRFV